MRSLIIAGVLLIAVGLFAILKPPTYSREESVFKLGDLEARVQQQRTVPAWVGGARGAYVVRYPGGGDCRRLVVQVRGSGGTVELNMEQQTLTVT